jgi:hypothetical protein
MRSKRFGQVCTHPERPVALATKFCVLAPNIFKTITAVHFSLQNVCRPASSVGIATPYGLDGPGN